MAPGDQVGEAHVDIHINSGPGEAELAAFKAKVERDFAELDRQKAEATLQLKSTEFDAKINKAKQELDNLERRKAHTSVELDTAEFDKEIAECKAEIKALGREKATVNVDLRQLRAANRETRLLADAHKLEERAALQSAKAERAVTTERQRASASAIKARADIARLSTQYEKLRGQQRAIEKESRRVFSKGGPGLTESEARRLERLGAEIDHVGHKITELGGDTSNLDRQMQHTDGTWGRWLGRLKGARVRIGPLSTSVAGLGTAIGVLGPLITELGGGLVALAGTIGEGLAGAATVGAGAMAGFALSAAGVGFIIGPMIGEFKEAAKAEEALSKAQLKYGKNSTQAKTAQEQLNHELKGISPVAREGIEAYGGLKTKWKELTKAAKPAVFTAFGESLKTVQGLLPTFARESTKTTQVAGKAWDSWMKSLRSSEAKHIIGSIMSDFRASIPGLSSGIGSLVAMLGRLAAAGAHFLPGLSNGFAEWANNLERAVGGGQKLQSDVGNMVSQMRDLGHLTQDTGSLLVHIFSAGASSGQGMVKSLDQVIKRWNAWTQTARGKAGLKEFFGDSKTATEDFMSSIAHATKLLFEFSRATAPVANGLLKVVTFIGDIVSAADNIVGVKQVFQGLGIILAGLFVASKVMAYGDAIKTVATRLMAIPGAVSAWVAGEQAITASAAEATTAMEAETAAAADAEVAAAGMGLTLGASGAALEETAGSAGILSAALAPEVLIPVGVVAGIAALTLALRGSSRTLGDVEVDFRKAGQTINHALDTSSKSIDRYVKAQHDNISASRAAAAARQHLTKLQRENAPANKITQAVEALNDAERRQAAEARRTGVVNKEQIASQKQLIEGAKKRVTSAKEEIHTLKLRAKEEEREQKNLAGGGNLPETRKKQAEAERNLATAMKDVSRAQKAEAATAVPYERSRKGLKAITDQTERGLRRLANTIGATATKKIGSFVNPQDVARVTELGNKLTKLGRGGSVKSIAVKSQGADQTIAKLQRLQHQTNRVESARASIKIGANDTQAQSKLRHIAALSQHVTGAKQTVHILANADSAEQAIHRLRSHLIGAAKDKYQAEITAVDKGSGIAHSFHEDARQAVNQKYSARIEAIDNASSKAKSAEGAGKHAAGRPYKLNITATNEQAINAINAVQAGLASLHNKEVSINVVTHKSGGFSGGPAAAFYTPFAAGGISDRELQRANEKAIRQQSGPSRKVTRPTMLVGEQAPQHPEFVIATNPAFRTDNERYLDQAAGHLGYEVVPAYKKGKGGGKKGKGGGNSGGSGGGESATEKTQKTLANHPPRPKNRPHKIAKVEHWGPVAAYNQAETDAGIKEEIYGQVFSHDEAEIKAGRMSNWEFGRLRSLLSDQAADYRHLGALVPDIRNAVNNELGHIHSLVDGKGEFSKHAIHDLNHQEAVEKAKLGKLKQGKNESDAAFRKRKLPYEHAITQLGIEKHKAEKERDRLLSIRQEAKQELSEVTGAKKMNEAKTNAERSEDELQYIEDVESGAVEAPYAESEEAENWKPGPEMETAKAELIGAELAGNTSAMEAIRKRMVSIAEGEYNAALATPGVQDDIAAGEQLKQLREEATNNGGKATLGEQTASYNEARAQLYEQFASNIFGQLTPSAAPGMGQPSYLPGGMTAMGMATPSLQSSAYHPDSTKMVQVVNNFAAPPPDPHTWTKQQEFELGTLA